MISNLRTTTVLNLWLMVTTALISSSAYSDTFGLSTAHTSNMENSPEFSIDLGRTVYHKRSRDIAGSVSKNKYESKLMRANFAIWKRLLVSSELGEIELDGDLKGTTVGAGFMYQIPLKDIEDKHLGVRSFYREGDLTIAKTAELAVDFIVGFDQIFRQIGNKWSILKNVDGYLTAGAHKLELDSAETTQGDEDTVMVLGFGLIGPLAVGEWFLQLNYVRAVDEDDDERIRDDHSSDGSSISAGLRFVLPE